MRVLRLVIFCCVVWLCESGKVLAGVVVVVHPNNSIDGATEELVTNLFLGKRTRFPNGKFAIPIDQIEGGDPREEFYRKVAHKTPPQLNAYWSRLIFTGKGHPPKAVEDSLDVLELVAANPNFIGYVASELVDESVKVILITD